MCDRCVHGCGIAKRILLKLLEQGSNTVVVAKKREKKQAFYLDKSGCAGFACGRVSIVCMLVETMHPEDDPSRQQANPHLEPLLTHARYRQETLPRVFLNPSETIMTLPKAYHLNTGCSIPAVGLGTFQSGGDKAVVIKQVKDALEVGYRHVDTAMDYKNEKEVGKALRESGISRADLFVTTKLFVAQRDSSNRTLTEKQPPNMAPAR